MGIFDIFGTGDQQAAAQAQIAGLNAGYGQASGAINTGINSLTTNYGNAANALTSNSATAGNALTTGYGTATGALNTGYTNANNALTGNYMAALKPYLQNYGQAQAGVNQLGNVLGLNGAAGSDSAMKTLQNTPGYQFQLQQGDNAANAAAAANGTLNSGNQLLALSNYNQGLAGTTYNNYVSQLEPYLGASNTAAAGIGNTLTGLGNAQAANATGLGTSLASAATGLGSSLASNSNALGSNLASTYTGLGSATAGQQDLLANLGYATQTGIGNANANADLAGLTASGNIWNMLGSLGGMKTSGGGSLGGNAVQGLGSLAMSIFSDERLKEDIEKVGELFDGTNVYSYRYKGSPVPQIGLMAQEVEKTNPDAVTEIGGYKAVDYGKATRYAAELSSFLDDQPQTGRVVEFAPRARALDATAGSFAPNLARFLEAA